MHNKIICGTCEWFHDGGKTPNDQVGECRGGLPKINTPLAMQLGSPFMSLGFWPIVYKDAPGCFRWTMKMDTTIISENKNGPSGT